jgi:hypothetical protein
VPGAALSQCSSKALLEQNTSRHRVLTERGGRAAYLIVSLSDSPGSVVTVAPVLRFHLLGVLVPVELEAFLWRVWSGLLCRRKVRFRYLEVLKSWAEEWAKEGVKIDWEKLLQPKGFQVLLKRWVVEWTFS